MCLQQTPHELAALLDLFPPAHGWPRRRFKLGVLQHIQTRFNGVVLGLSLLKSSSSSVRLGFDVTSFHDFTVATFEMMLDATEAYFA